MLDLIAAAVLATGNCNASALPDVPAGSFVGVFNNAWRIQKIDAAHYVWVLKGATLAEEQYLIPSVELLSPTTIISGQTRLADGGRLLVGALRDGLNWACLAHREGEARPESGRPSLCIRDDDGDGLYDRAAVAGEERPLNRIRLAPVTQFASLKRATSVRIKLEVKSVGPNSIEIVSISNLQPRGGLYRYRVSLADQDKSQAAKSHTLQLRDGETLRINGVKLHVARAASGWWIRAEGAFRKAVKLCDRSTTAWIGGAKLIRY